MDLVRVVVNVPHTDWRKLRDLAEERAPSGRASVGAILRDLIRAELVKHGQRPAAPR